MLYDTMERLVLFLVFVVSGVSPMITAKQEPSRVVVCRAPKSVGGWIGGKGDEGYNEIRRIAIIEDAKSGLPLGWFYHLNDQSIYFEPALTYTIVSPPGRAQYAAIEANGKGPSAQVRVNDQSALAAAIGTRKVLTLWHIRPTQAPTKFQDLMRGNIKVEIQKCGSSDALHS